MDPNRYDPQEPTPLWHVVKVEDSFGAATLGGSTRYKRVTYRVMDGSESFVDVPYVDFANTDKIKQTIDEAVSAHLLAAGLKSDQMV